MRDHVATDSTGSRRTSVPWRLRWRDDGPHLPSDAPAAGETQREDTDAHRSFSRRCRCTAVAAVPRTGRDRARLDPDLPLTGPREERPWKTAVRRLVVAGHLGTRCG
jgi:hypothetical protein